MGMITTVIAIIFIIIGSIIDLKNCPNCYEMEYKRPVNTEKISVAFGTILFTYGGHSVIPTIQHDMKKPSDFGKTSFLSFLSKL